MRYRVTGSHAVTMADAERVGLVLGEERVHVTPTSEHDYEASLLTRKTIKFSLLTGGDSGDSCKSDAREALGWPQHQDCW